MKKKHKKKKGGRPANPDANVVRLNPPQMPTFPNLLGGPITPEEQQRNEEYFLKRLKHYGLSG